MKLHPDCYKIKDRRMDLLLNGRMSIESFVLTVGENDPFVLYGDTVYALSETEFYSTRGLKHMFDEHEQVFKYYMFDDSSLENLEPADKDFILKVRKELPTCPVCKYKRYKQGVRKIADKYLKRSPKYTTESLIEDVIYPETKGEVASTITMLLDKPYIFNKVDRLPCMNCVEKHVAQAHILACESKMGYPEHRVLMCGHLAEAIDEAPKEFPDLRESLENCLAITMKTGEAYLPLYPILNMIELIRKRLSVTTMVETRDENPTVIDTIDITDDIQRELTAMPKDLKALVKADAIRIKDFILKYKIDKNETYRVLFEGTLAVLADSVVYAAPLFANMLRNRRIMFVADPTYAADAGYDFSDVIAAVGKP